MIADIKKRALHRSRILQGQLRGLERMIENEDYCVDIITQSLAVQKSLRSLNKLLVENHLRTHVTDMFEEGGDRARGRGRRTADGVRAHEQQGAVMDHDTATAQGPAPRRPRRDVPPPLLGQPHPDRPDARLQHRASGHPAPAGPRFPGSQWIPAAFGLAIFIYGGRTFLAGGWWELRHRTAGDDAPRFRSRSWWRSATAPPSRWVFTAWTSGGSSRRSSRSCCSATGSR